MRDRIVASTLGAIALLLLGPLAAMAEAAPVIGQEASLPRQTSATLGAFVDPAGSETTYRFEWGTTASYGNRMPAEPDPSIGAGASPVAVTVQLSGLMENTTYHFRVVATNAEGTTFGPDRTFTTYKPTGLPDNRAWEQVSPVDKNQSNIWAGGAVAASDGGRLFFFSPGGFAGAKGQFGLNGNAYLAARGAARWETESLMPVHGSLHFQNRWSGFSDDLSVGVLRWNDSSRFPPIDPEAVPGMNLYLRDNETHSYELLNGTLEAAGAAGGFAWASSNFSKIAFESQNHLTPDAPCFGGFQEECAYEWDEGALRLASVLPNGEPVRGRVGGGLEFGSGGADNAVSDDGSKLFFSSPWTGGEIYVREDGERTSHVSLSERTLPGGISGQPIHYQGAEAAHGDRVLFTTANTMVDADTDEGNDLYLYDFAEPAGERLILISRDRNPEAPEGAAVEGGGFFGVGPGGVVAKSDDLRRVYFVAANQIVEGEPDEPGPKLYLWDATGASPTVSYIATLSEGDWSAWTPPTVGEVGMKNSRQSDDGRFVAFVSQASPTPFESGGQPQIYLYDAESGMLGCASCSMDALPSTGYIGLGGGSFPAAGNHLLRNVSESGQVFFETARGLLPRDSNGKIDVYEYSGGHLHLISRGTGGGDSLFMDASPSGSDVFFTTRDRLVGWDRDFNDDAYDARVNGGLPEPPSEPPACEGDACQPPPVVPHDPPLASAGFQGPGDPAAKRRRRTCPTGKVRRRGKCRKRRSRRALGESRSRRQSTATRSHG